MYTYLRVFVDMVFYCGIGIDLILIFMGREGSDRKVLNY
jgi:hypothetical protein